MWKLLLILAAVLYFLLPYDVMPDLILGWGWLDDLVIGWLVWRSLRRLRPPKTASQTQGSGNGGFSEGDRTGSREDSPRDPYTVLGLSRNATPPEIRKAYRQLAGQYHPDKVSHLGREFQRLAEKRFKEIQEAYERLKP